MAENLGRKSNNNICVGQELKISFIGALDQQTNFFGLVPHTWLLHGTRPKIFLSIFWSSGCLSKAFHLTTLGH